MWCEGVVSEERGFMQINDIILQAHLQLLHCNNIIVFVNTTHALVFASLNVAIVPSISSLPCRFVELKVVVCDVCVIPAN